MKESTFVSLLHWFIPVVLLIACLATVLAYYFDTSKDKKNVVEQTTSTMSVQQGFDALFRGNNNVEKICYLPIRNAWFLEAKPPSDAGAGWYFIKDVPFYHVSQNDSWFIADILPNQYVKVYPDVTGLQCKNRTQ